MNTLFDFLENRIRALTICDEINTNKSKFYKSNNSDNNNNNNNTATGNNKYNKPTPLSSVRLHVATTNEPSSVNVQKSEKVFKCIFCKDNHPNFKCPSLLQKTQEEISNILAKTKTCQNCMRPNHEAEKCTRDKCKKCGLPHHTILHGFVKMSNEANFSNNYMPRNNNPFAPNNPETNKIIANVANINCKAGLLATISLLVFDSAGNSHKIRALLDPGAQAPFITMKLSDRLKLPLDENFTSITGVDMLQSHSDYSTKIKIASHDLEFVHDLEVLVLNKVTPNLPSKPLDNLYEKVSNLKLADPNFHKPSPVHMIIDVKLFPKILRPGTFDGNIYEPGRVNSVFGWLICGEIPTSISQSIYSAPSVVSNSMIGDLLEKFWKVEEVSTPSIPRSPENREVEQFYSQTTFRLPDGRFMVRLPFSENPKTLGDSRNVAVRILKSVFGRLNDEQRRQYSEFMHEYLQLNHMTKISKERLNHTPHFYLPHHPVFKDSTTSKIRIVFNASKKTTSGKSLNDILHIGPTVQDELIDILLRFRFFKVAICSDAEKCYR